MSTLPPRSSESPNPRRNNNSTVLIVVVVVVAVIIGFGAIALFVGNSSDDKATGGPGGGSTPSTTPTPTVPSVTVTSPTAGGPTNLPPLNCTAPPAKPANPKQFSKPPSAALAQNSTWVATIDTNCGTIVMDLDGKDAPQTVSSFIYLAQQKYFDDSPCHRLTTAAQGLSVLQCGDPTGSGSGTPGYGYGIENAPMTGAYPTGTVAMARTSDPNTNGSQFFIVYADTSLPTQGGGYSIFGKVVQGLPIVQAIAAKGLASDGQSPAQPISILNVSVAQA